MLQLLAETEAKRIAADIDRQGYGALAGYVSEDELKPVRAIAEAAVAAAGGEYVAFVGRERLAGTVLDELPRSAAFKDLCYRLYEHATGRSPTETDLFQILRCLQGASGQWHSRHFHYDSYVVSALLPVAIPKEGPSGDFVLIPSTRPIRQLYACNAIDQKLIRSKIAQLLLRLVARRRWLSTVAISLKPGTIYFFWGYRSIHTNEPSDPARLRATAVFHYGDPHRGSQARTLIRRIRHIKNPRP